MLNYQIRKTPGDSEWFRTDRFGGFIHWGLYALPARHEWVQWKEKLSAEHYDRYFRHFDPDLFHPEDWAKQMKAAGMKYVVLTAKHHEGFCMFDSAYTDFKVTNTAYGKDIVKECLDAFRKEGLRVGLYYSLIDWHHPHFTVDFNHPLYDAERLEELNRDRDQSIYNAYMRDQVTELLTNYGKIDILWFDYSYEGKGAAEWEAEKLISTVRALQPHILINNRTELEQDFWTPEQHQPLEWMRHPQTGELVTWEACQTLSGSWGYYRDEQTYKSPKMLIRLLIDQVALGGNLIMNVGPTAKGYFDKRASAALRVYEEWMEYHSCSIYGCTQSEACFEAPMGTRLTQSVDGKRLYIHLLEYPFAFLEFPNLASRIDYAQFLNDGSEVEFSIEKAAYMHGTGAQKAGNVIFSLPPIAPDVTVPVIEVLLK